MLWASSSQVSRTAISLSPQARSWSLCSLQRTRHNSTPPRNTGQSTNNIRIFERPKKFNLQSQHYSDILFWDEIEIYEPPVTKALTYTELEAYLNSDEVIELPQIPCHSQATERYIQEIAMSVTQVAGKQNQEGFIKNRIIHKTRMKTFNNKSDYQCQEE